MGQKSAAEQTAALGVNGERAPSVCRVLALGKWQVKGLCLNLSQSGPAESQEFTHLQQSGHV